MKNLTLEDIARRAGVSPATVSRVINDQVGARSKAREQVLRVIQETGFQPHAAARSLAARRTNVLGLLYAAPANTVLTHPNLLNLAEVLTQACHEAGQVLSLFLTSSGVHEEALLTRITRPGLVDGLIVRAAGGDESIALYRRLSAIGIPYVAVGRPPNPQGISYVATDNVTAAYHAATHLIRLGHTRLGLMVYSTEFTHNQERVAGFYKAMDARGIPVDEKLIVRGNTDAVDLDMQAFLQQQPTAIVLETRMAATVLPALHRLGVRVPEDIAIVGFDDLPLAQEMEPALTTTRRPMAAIGAQLVSILLEMIENDGQPPRQVVFEPELVIRYSCGARSR